MRLNKVGSSGRRILYSPACILLLYFLISCSAPEQEIIREDRIIEMESSRDLWGNIVFCVEKEETPFIYYYSRGENKLFAYQLEDDIFKERSSLDMGKEFNNIYIRNPDSIFLFHDRKGNFSLLNHEYKLVDTFTVPLVINSVDYSIYSASSQHTGWYEINLILSVLPSVPLNIFYRSFIEIKYSLEQHKIIDHFLTFPSNYDENHWWGGTGITYSKCINPKGDIIFSFSVVNNLFEFSNGEVQKIEVPQSHFFSVPPPMKNEFIKNPRYSKVYQDTIGFYSDIMYDPYRDLYLRVAAHNQPPTYVDSVTNTLKNNMFFDRGWSIMFFDREFNLIGEQKFEEKHYFFGNVFIIKDGILVAMGDGQSRGENIRFQLFKYNP